MMRSVVISLAMILLSAPLIHGQDLSKYRTFVRMSWSNYRSRLIHNRSTPKLIHKRPALIQEFGVVAARLF